MNRINKGQKYILRDCVSSGLSKMITSSDNFDILKNKAEKYSKNTKSKRIYGFSIFERTGGGRGSEKLIKTFFKED